MPRRSAQGGGLRGQLADPLPVAGGDRVGGGEPGAADAADVRPGRGTSARWPSRDAAGRAEAYAWRERTGHASFRYGTPPDASAGKNFISVRPASSTASTSETVDVPGRNGTPVVAHRGRAASGVSTGGDQEPGARRHGGLGLRARELVIGAGAEQRSPAPRRRWPGGRRAPPGVRRVSSMAGRPPSASARATGHGRGRRSSMTTTGITGDDVEHRGRREATVSGRGQGGLQDVAARGSMEATGKIGARLSSAGADGSAEGGEAARGRCRAHSVRRAVRDRSAATVGELVGVDADAQRARVGVER